MEPGLSSLLDEIVRLDERSMREVLARSGEAFQPARRRRSLIDELGRGSRLVAYSAGAGMLGYLQILPERGACRVLSLQIRSGMGGLGAGAILRRLISALLASWPDLLECATIESSAHTSNPESMSFHARLGFHSGGTRNRRVSFQAATTDLAPRLRRLCQTISVPPEIEVSKLGQQVLVLRRR